jgi:hypothetical protein
VLAAVSVTGQASNAHVQDVGNRGVVNRGHGHEGGRHGQDGLSEKTGANGAGIFKVRGERTRDSDKSRCRPFWMFATAKDGRAAISGLPR